MAGKLQSILRDIKLPHTIFALPFAVMSAFLAAEGLPEWGQLFWIVMAMVGGRSAAMAFNRIVDARFDAKNPRTEKRALPAGEVDKRSYLIFLVASSLLLVYASYRLNSLAFYLSPVALAIVFSYSLAKRFTAYSHVWLGFAISVAPVGAWVAIREEISLVSLVLAAAVVFWLAGFDIIYSCLDAEFDRTHGLHSVPQRFGVALALRLSFASHALMVLFLIALSFVPLLGWMYLLGVLATAALLWYEHSLVRADDLSKVNMAFFNVNGCVSLLLMFVVIADCL
ncbi:MAG: UbiA family prenyltransferase [Candidatus Nitrohelix vancouverensis]|uniref:4-hydroxybenzoate polyprenyltransferase n=1 Tax=Candidatus Nitrohelix vancouverensis TaxID=2705534 RepID=A0A7T0G3S2_9BACT|nr:MAG: UbiA family prenyltransferase [Candidatus Nitrohelix vancouverensis]